MKSLNQYIEEKLKINKDFKGLAANAPNKEGCFLRVFINTIKNNDVYRIDIEAAEYEFENNTFIDKKGPYIKNEKGYYCTDERYDGAWMTLALIETDAIDFLNNLLNDMNKKDNLYDYLDESQQKLVNDKPRTIYCSDEKNNPRDLTEKRIIDLIDKIK